MAQHRRPGAGSVRRLPSGRWQARRTEADGTVRSLGTWLTKAEADRALAAAELDELAGDRVLDDGGTVGEWADRWLAEGSHRWKPSTARGNAVSVTNHVLPYLAAVRINQLDRAAIFGWLDKLRTDRDLSPRTVHMAAANLAAVLETAVEHGALRANPATRLRLPRRRVRPPRFLTIDQVDRLADEIEHPPRRLAGHGATTIAPPSYPAYGLLVRFAAWTGLRPAEITALRCGQVDLERHVIYVLGGSPEVAGRIVNGTTKTDATRRVPYPAAIAGLVATHVRRRVATSGPDSWMFVGASGGQHRHSTFSARHFRPAAERVGLVGLIFYDLRHTFASTMIAAGVHPRVLQELMGHSSIAVTMNVYGHLFPGVAESAVDALSERIATAEARRSTCEGSGTTLARAPESTGENGS